MLKRRVSALAASFAASGLRGERIGLMLPNSIDLVCCYLPCFRAGAVAAPVRHSFFGPTPNCFLQILEHACGPGRVHAHLR
ncbi:MAG: AMP-binding protein [Beijerinckiaceae bacterium]|nr:AMP-binding protein [Beijerinckiaceae bacterium]